MRRASNRSSAGRRPSGTSSGGRCSASEWRERRRLSGTGRCRAARAEVAVPSPMSSTRGKRMSTESRGAHRELSCAAWCALVLGKYVWASASIHLNRRNSASSSQTKIDMYTLWPLDSLPSSSYLPTRRPCTTRGGVDGCASLHDGRER